MPLQDLTPQLRTRLSRIERMVGWFVTVAAVILIAGFGYYVYHTAERKGWFITKVHYSTSLNDATGLKPGDPIKLMGFDVGEITGIEANAPAAYFGVTIFFRVKDPYYGYIWLDSKARVAPSDFLGHRYIEIIKGRSGAPTVLEKQQRLVLNHKLAKEQFDALIKSRPTDNLAERETIRSEATNQLNDLLRQQPSRFYTNLAHAEPYWIGPIESPALTERLEAVVKGAEQALPNILNLTNQLSALLTNAGAAAARLDATISNAAPIVTNLAIITSNLRETNGSLGNWLFSSNLQAQIERTVTSGRDTLRVAHSTLKNADTNLTAIATELDRSLQNLASLTSNLNVQVQSNSNILSQVSTAVVHTDELVQGLKRHWLLRSAFKKKPAPSRK